MALGLAGFALLVGTDCDLLNVPGGECTVGRSTGPIDDVTRRQYDFFVWRLQGAGIPYWNDPKENAR